MRDLPRRDSVNVSVVICTRNRPDTIGQALQSVAECEYPSFDVHVMDQSTDDQTQKVVEEIASRFAHKLKINYHHLEKAGLSRAYNLGIAASAVRTTTSSCRRTGWRKLQRLSPATSRRGCFTARC
jgi:hypothetical protein